MTNIDKVSLDGGRDGHSRRDEMRASARSLSPFEIPIAGRGAALARFQHIGVHCETHTAAGLPPLKSGFSENLVEAFLFGLLFDETGAGDHHCMHSLGDMFAFGQRRGKTQIFNA